MTPAAFPQAMVRALEPVSGQPAWRRRLRQTASAWLAERGFPTTKDDAWKYARLAPLLQVPFEPAPAPLVDGRHAGDFADLGGARLVFVNGTFAAELSTMDELPDSVRLTRLATTMATDSDGAEALLARPFREHPDAFTALNVALAEDGGVLEIAPHATLVEPIHVVFLSAPDATPRVLHPRLAVMAGANSRATIVETHTGLGGGVYLSNAITELSLGPGAVLDHYNVQQEAETAFHVGLLRTWQDRGSHLSSQLVALGSAMARHEVTTQLAAPEAEVALHGLYLPAGTQHLDNPTTIEHVAPHCTSRELYKGIVDARGRGVFDGRIVIRPGAVGSDARQSNKSLLLSAMAQADARPRLEIFNDDVKCSHGAVIGQLDEDQVFYLRSRGIPEGAARSLLSYAFAREMLELIRVERLRALVERLVARKLQPRAPEVLA